MAQAKNSKPAAKTSRTPLVAPPKPAKANDPALTKNTTIGDPRDANQLPEADRDALAAEALAGRPIADPPTPTRETALTANDEPGAGGLPATDAAPLARTKLQKDEKMVTVAIPQAFVLTDDQGRQHRYEAGFGEMPASHSTHWFTKAQGVEVKD